MMGRSLLFALVSLCAATVWAEKPASDEGRIVFEQKFNWHDSLGSGEYVWGREEYLAMDGSDGKIQCSRLLKERITDRKGRVEFDVRLARGKIYGISFYDSEDRKVLDCRVERSGQVRFSDGDSFVDAGVGIGSAGVWADWSKTHTLGFGQIDFSAKTFVFTFDEKSMVDMPLSASATNVARVELRTLIVEKGTLIWLDNFRQLEEPNVTVDTESFNQYWVPCSGIPRGMPGEKWQEIRYRPKDYKWLEVGTTYGAVYVRFTDRPVKKGVLELEMITDNIEAETQLNLGEYQKRSEYSIGVQDEVPGGAWRINVGIFAERWIPFKDWEADSVVSIRKPFGHGVPFDNALTPVADKIYKLQIAWDAGTQTHRIWIDGVAQLWKGSVDIPMLYDLKEGVDMIMIHPGNLNPDLGPYLYSRWGNIKVVSHDQE